MNKIMNGLKFVWKNNRVWLLVTSIALVFLLAISIVATQILFISNTISTVLGGERRILVSGDPSAYEYYNAGTDDFKTYEPENLDYTGKSLFDYGSKASKQAKTDTMNEANRFNERIVEEGIVLLKNKKDDADGYALPLSTTVSAKLQVSVFGKNSVNLVRGGSGSGDNSSANSKTIYDSLSAANFDYNPTLKSFYESSASGKGRSANPTYGDKPIGLSTGETAQGSYTQTVKESYTGYNDAAIVVFSRIGGEGWDLPRTMLQSDGKTAIDGATATDHYLQLDNNERDLLTEVCNGQFKKVIVVINCSTSMELGFIGGNDNIDAALWLGSPGGYGVMALGRVLNGEVTPSGRLVDTYARTFKNDPTWANFAFYDAPGERGASLSGNEYITTTGKVTTEYFAAYAEDIYVGYRYYETRAYEMYDEGDAWYDEAVVYPLGYGLSYTDFKWEIVEDGTSSTAEDLTKYGTITVKVKVTNIGDYPGKDVVQLYYTSKYNYGLQKAHVLLGDFAKTKMLSPKGQPGDSDTVTLTLKVPDMASYDRNNIGQNEGIGYKLEPGPYIIRIGENAHASWAGTKRAANNGLLTKTYWVDEGFLYDEDPVTGKTVENRFDNINGVNVSNYIKDQFGINYLSRDSLYLSDLKFDSLTPTAEKRKVEQDFLNKLNYTTNDSEKKWYVEESKMPLYGQTPEDGNYIQLYELISRDNNGNVYVDYEDGRWKTILDYITIAEMSNLIGTGNYNSARIDSIGKPRTTDPDGPAGFTNFMGDPTVYDTCYYAGECVIAATWNKDLIHDMGVMVGLEGLWGNQKGDGRPYSGWYAPAVNIHRSPFSGRNFEYYSEDSYLSGIMAANVIQGAKTKGVYTYVKHFALNDQETDRGGVCTWASEQAIREIYLKPFEIAVKVGKTTAAMSSFNRIGPVWAGGCYELLTEILREEWGFRGMVVSDYNTYGHMPADQMIRAGGDLNLIQDKRPTTTASALTATQITAMRNATKNILYTVAASNAMNGSGKGVVWGYVMPIWKLVLIWVDVAIIVGLAVWGFFAIRRKVKKVKANQ